MADLTPEALDALAEDVKTMSHAGMVPNSPRGRILTALPALIAAARERCDIADHRYQRVLLQRDVARAQVAAVEALDRGHITPGCRFPDDACVCTIGLFDLRAALGNHVAD